MNINITNRNVFFFVNLVIFIVIMAIIYIFVYAKYSDMLNEKKVIYNRFYDINMQLNDFSTIQRSIDEQKEKINETVSEYQDYFIPNDEIINRYKVQIIKLLKQYEIKVNEENIKQIQKNNNILLSLDLKASYDQIYKFLFDIEKFSAVSSVSVSYNGSVTVECSPVLYSSSVNDYFSGRVEQSIDEISAKGYFKEISDKIFAAMDVGYIPTWRDLLPVPRNPFISGFVQEKVVKKVASAQPVIVREAPVIVLEGIMYESKNPIVIIEGQLYPKGSVYKGAKIIKIDQNSITVDFYGKNYTIKMLN
ncbi:MAG: hypothetical protein VB017_02600 [Endomicrobiaceae bacterium]|nr:hypothetical protein [Endomicrobiaceae bacterium]